MIIIVGVFILIFGGFGFLAFREEIMFWLKSRRNDKLSDAFPDFYKWKEGDAIVIYTNPHNTNVGQLVAMTDKFVVLDMFVGNTNQPQMVQISLISHNKSLQKRKKEEEIRAFHEEVLPLLSEESEEFKYKLLMD